MAMPSTPQAIEESWCIDCQMHYADCACIGPMQDGYEYQYDKNGRLIAREILEKNL